MMCVHKDYCIYKPAYLLMVRDKLIKKIVGYRDKYQNRSWAVIRGGMQRPLMSVFEILAKLTLSLMVINGH